jgi:signal transduction histidine kinase
VSDNGIGIPADERVRIFDKFYGVGDIAHHTSGDTAFMSKGSGLGLSIVRGIMDAHEGVVWVEEAEGGGSTFSLLFPLG